MEGSKMFGGEDEGGYCVMDMKFMNQSGCNGTLVD